MMRLACAIALVLSGCGSLVPSTVARLQGVSPVEADPAGFEVALSLPAGLDLRPGSAVLRLGAERADTGARSEAAYALARREGAVAGVAVPPGGSVVVFSVAGADLARLRAQQSLIRGWKAESGAATKGVLAIAAGGCSRGDGPGPGARVSVHLRTEAGGPFLPLVRGGPVAAILGAQEAAALPPCPEPAAARIR